MEYQKQAVVGWSITNGSLMVGKGVGRHEDGGGAGSHLQQGTECGAPEVPAETHTCILYI